MSTYLTKFFRSVTRAKDYDFKIEGGLDHIASNHYGECFFDSVQNILMFADGYREINAVFSEKMFNRSPYRVLNVTGYLFEKMSKVYGRLPADLKDFLADTFRRYCLIRLNELEIPLEFGYNYMRKRNKTRRPPLMRNHNLTKEERAKLFFKRDNVNDELVDFVNGIYQEGKEKPSTRMRTGSVNNTAGVVLADKGMKLLDGMCKNRERSSYSIFRKINNLKPFSNTMVEKRNFYGLDDLIAVLVSLRYERTITEIAIVRYRGKYYILDSNLGVALEVSDIHLFNGMNLNFKYEGDNYEYFFGETRVAGTKVPEGKEVIYMNMIPEYQLYIYKRSTESRVPRGLFTMKLKKNLGLNLTKINLKIEDGLSFIASQHNRECYFDTIQNILMFADGYREINASFAQRLLQTIPNDLLTLGNNYVEKVEQHYMDDHSELTNTSIMQFFVQMIRRYCLIKLNELGITRSEIHQVVPRLETNNIVNVSNAVNMNSEPMRMRSNSINVKAGIKLRETGLEIVNENTEYDCQNSSIIFEKINSLKLFRERFWETRDYEKVLDPYLVAVIANIIGTLTKDGKGSKFHHEVGIIRYRGEFYILDNNIGIALHIKDGINDFNGENFRYTLEGGVNQYFFGDKEIARGKSSTSDTVITTKMVNGRQQSFIYLDSPKWLRDK